jgi:molybdate/tungstate transport system permease protein
MNLFRGQWRLNAPAENLWKSFWFPRRAAFFFRKRTACLLILAFLSVPLFSLATGGEWSQATISGDDLRAIVTSLLGGGIALALIFCAGTPLAWVLAHQRSIWGAIGEALVLIPMLMPTLALGILLVAFYGPATPVGAAFARIGISLTNSMPAFVLAALYAALPIYVIAAKAAFGEVPAALEDVARTLGESETQVFFRISLPLASRGVAAALALAWVRAMGEFGIVLILAYFPQGMPVRLWVDVQELGVAAVFPLLAVFVAAALPLPLWLGLRARRAAR